MSYIDDVKGAELLKRLRRLGKASGVPIEYDGKPGKGSHGRLYYGAAFTTIKDPRKEIGPDLLAKMLRDLGLTKDDLK
jgi:mRNA interferase HicA